MSEGPKQQMDTSSTEFKDGTEAGLDSAKDAKNWKSGNELGQEFKAEVETKEPLFMEGSPEGNKGNAQDEKDETEE